jgi:F-type H+-transporting ATPase subunit epsilon
VLLQVVTPEGEVVDEQVEQVIAPGVQGEFGVLPGHIPFLSALRPGILTYVVRGAARRIAVAGGLADIGAHERVLVLVEDARKPEEMDSAKLRERLTKLEAKAKAWEGPLEGSEEEAAAQYQALAEQIAWLQAQLQLAE